ncbi:hypothetical protein JW835_12990 [bacterium]|nr:hypothetical protein [bacterium]
MKNVNFLILVILISVGGCNNKHKTSTYQTKPEFINAYIDLLYLQERVNPSSPAYEDSALIVLQKHDLTQLECTQIINALNKKPKRWKAFLQDVQNRLNNIDSTQVDIRNPIKSFTNRGVE